MIFYEGIFTDKNNILFVICYKLPRLKDGFVQIRSMVSHELIVCRKRTIVIKVSNYQKSQSGISDVIN